MTPELMEEGAKRREAHALKKAAAGPPRRGHRQRWPRSRLRPRDALGAA
jgi:hypothetical protein